MGHKVIDIEGLLIPVDQAEGLMVEAGVVDQNVQRKGRQVFDALGDGIRRGKVDDGGPDDVMAFGFQIGFQSA